MRGSRVEHYECGECSEKYSERIKAIDKFESIQHDFKMRMYELEPFNKIPKRFKDKTLDNYEANSNDQSAVLNLCKKYIENYDTVKEKGTCLVFCGMPGTGKTHLAYAIVKALREQMVCAIKINAAEMTSVVKEAITGKTDESAGDVSSTFKRIDMLVIDEVGVQVESDSERRVFFDIINGRYDEMRPTILISNLKIEELTKFIGVRVIDRMKENNGVVFGFGWNSYR